MSDRKIAIAVVAVIVASLVFAATGGAFDEARGYPLSYWQSIGEAK